MRSEEFAKPDRHVINALEAYEGERMNPTRAFEALQRYSNEANIRPRRLDKVFYLAGSGNFYLTEFNFGPQFKQGFLEHLRRKGIEKRSVGDNTSNLGAQRLNDQRPIINYRPVSKDRSGSPIGNTPKCTN